LLAGYSRADVAEEGGVGGGFAEPGEQLAGALALVGSVGQRLADLAGEGKLDG
jgi:hypothetical protein